MDLTIKSKILGREFTFWMSQPRDKHSTSYVRLTDARHPGTTGQQICYGGGFRGNTVYATADNFEAECRAWYRDHLKSARDFA